MASIPVELKGWTMEDLAAVLMSQLKIIECAVCLEAVQPDMVQCVNGHVICSKCKGDQDKCPTCKQPFSNVEQPSALAQLVAAIPHQCKHTNCTTLVRPGSDHEGYCGWRLTQCKVEQCGWSGPAREMMDHVREKHSDRIVFIEENSIKVYVFDFTPDENYSIVYFCLLHGQFFWESVTNDIDKEIFTVQFTCVPDGKPRLNIFLKVTFSSTNTEHSTKMKLNLDPEAAGTNKNVVVVPQHMLADFINEDRRLCFKLDVTKSTVDNEQ